jgi:hypothetical protein
MLTELRKIVVSDLTDDADVVTNADDATNLDGTNGLVTAAAIYGRVSDTLVKPVKLNASTHALVTISYEHNEIHGGDHYFLNSVVDISINNVYDIQITTPNTTEWAHFAYRIECESETNLFIYEGVTIVTPGTTLTPRNNNRNSLNTSGLTVAGIANSSVANANADTATAGAITLVANTLGSGNQDSGARERTNEIILKQNTSYCLRFVAVSAGYTDYNLSWYEHTNLD